MTDITVYKRNHLGEIKVQYAAHVLDRGPNWICIEAVFGHDDVDIGVVTFRRGDRMIEWFYSDRYYNIFQLEEDGRLKGWYCNITRPAEISQTMIAADDLALDVFVAPDKTITVLDEDEFAELELSDDDHKHALAAVEALIDRVERRERPFDQGL